MVLTSCGWGCVAELVRAEGSEKQRSGQEGSVYRVSGLRLHSLAVCYMDVWLRVASLQALRLVGCGLAVSPTRSFTFNPHDKLCRGVSIGLWEKHLALM